MILSWMLYATGVALLLGCAAAGAESACRQRGWPIRGVWAGALLASTLGPAAVLLAAYGIPDATDGTPPPPVPPAADWVSSIRALAVSAAPRAVDLDPWILGFWAAASAGFAGWLVLALLELRRRRAAWTSRRLDGRTVWVSADTGPAVFGVIRSRIVVPAWILERGETDRAMILAHEEEHVLARDPPLLAASLLLLVLLPWNLPLWWQRRRLREAVEVDCDRRVLARGPDPRAYGRMLVEVNQKGTVQRLAVAALAESPSFLERRIRTMITPRHPHWRLYAACSIAVSVVALAAACSIDHPSGLGTPTRERTSAATESLAVTYDVGELDRLPEVRNVGEIVATMNRLYPESLRDTEGMAVVQFVVTAEGTVDPASLRVVSATHEAFGQASVKVAETLTFNPGRYRGEAVRARLELPMTWKPTR